MGRTRMTARTFMACSRKPRACFTVSANADGCGPSKMEP